MKLYNYCRSSASFRVRIALNLKGLPFDYIPVHLVRGEQLQEAHRARSPDALVPVLEVDGHTLSQSVFDCTRYDDFGWLCKSIVWGACAELKLVRYAPNVASYRLPNQSWSPV